MAELQPSPQIVEKIEQVTGYANRRRMEYGYIEEQLDMLFKDIESGLFGEAAKTGAFYTYIKSIKDSHPKPENLDQLKTELDVLIQTEHQENN